MKNVLRCLLFLMAISSAAAADLPRADRLSSLHTWLTQVREDWKVPGMAVGILHRDTVVLARGFGVRTIGERDSVDEHTLFAVASLTKAFTAATVAMLVDRGLVRWDAPVQDYLSWFSMHDPWVTREMTVRDLLCHRSGLHTFGGDLIWYGTTYTRKEVVRRIRFLRPRHSFRAAYGYQNIMFIAAGEVIEAVTGRSWDDVIQDGIFVPLGMSRSTTHVRDLAQVPNVATPHIERDGSVMPVPYRDVDNAGPAAAVNSSVSDLLRWARLWLLPADSAGPVPLSAAARHEVWSPHTPIRLSARSLKDNPDRHFYVAGLGWFLFDYAGRKVVTHGGAMDGMLSQITLVPEEGIAIVLLTNSDGSPVEALSAALLDKLLGRSGQDWLGDAFRRRQASEQRRAARRAEQEVAEHSDGRPALPLHRYLGMYRSDLYGDVRIAKNGSRLVAFFLPTPSFIADLTHRHDDTFSITLRDPVLPGGTAQFVLDAEGKPVELRIDIPNPDFDFTELELKRVEGPE